MLLMNSKDLPFMASHSFIFVFSLSYMRGAEWQFTLIMVPKNFEQLPSLAKLPTQRRKCHGAYLRYLRYHEKDKTDLKLT